MLISITIFKNRVTVGFNEFNSFRYNTKNSTQPKMYKGITIFDPDHLALEAYFLFGTLQGQ
jgi:hypothetical protein